MRFELTPLSDDERGELSALLERCGENALAIESLDGLFAALVCSPVVAVPGEWMPVIWGGEPPEWESRDEIQRFTELVMRHWNHVAASINDGTYAPLFVTALDKSGREVVLAHHWCMGFFDGMQMHDAHWSRTDDELQRLLHPIKVLYADALLINSESRPKRIKHLPFAEMNRLADAIPRAVIELRAYWLEHPAGAGPAAQPGPGLASRRTAHNAPVREKGTWIAGLGEFPALVGDEDRAYRPLAALVLDFRGLVLALALRRPEEPDAAVAEALRSALEAPAVGEAGPPERVVVPAREMVALVARALPGVEIAVGPAPELDEALESLREHAASHREREARGYLSADVTPSTMAAFFEAAAELYQRAPWTVVPDDESLFGITSSGLGIRAGVVCVIGQMGENYGVILFNSAEDFARFQRMASLAMAGAEPRRGFPRHAALNYEHAKDMPPAMREEIRAHKWPVAGPAAFPQIMLVEPDMTLRPPARDDYRRMEGVCRAITRLIDTEAGLARAWRVGPRLRRRVTVDVDGTPVSVTISVR
ncbi:MAG TPA: UPF0149 family protein [Candidatus Krumholzibacteria bacterium]|nr:UPF0149 family protein [Candidatus Krumholzibacteria bacterium]